MKDIRNIAIVAHVDHGKTTIVDGLLKQSNLFRDNQSEMDTELLMDSGDQEKERGITITAKITAVDHDDTRINIIDTPGHADFSGEVERTLNMADGCLLVVDAQEGPMPQTKFVLGKALEHKLKPIVVINKIDKPGSRVSQVEDELADLFLELAVEDSQLQYPVYYAVGRDGKAWTEMPSSFEDDSDFAVLFDAIKTHVPPPDVDADGPFQMQVTALSWDSYKGKYAIGRINRGGIKRNDQVVVVDSQGTSKSFKIDGLYMSRGLSKFEVDDAHAGDIVQLTGIADAGIGQTLCDPAQPDALADLEVEDPTLQIYLGPNTSPMKGQEGKFTTSRQISDRLQKELETNVGLRVEPQEIGFKVSGRGELHLSVLIETMRREGFEFEVGRPQVVVIEKDGQQQEPLEELHVEVPDEHVGAVQQELGARRATLKSQQASAKGSGTELVYEIPTRAIIGLRGILLTETKGTIIMNSSTIGHLPLTAAVQSLRNGVLIANEAGTTTPYSLQNIEPRGILFVPPAIKVYQGMIIGLNARKEDMEVNPTKAKKLDNMRSNSSDGTIQLTPPTIFSLEQSMDFIEDDELLEVTPENLRLRKKHLNPSDRKRAAK